MAWHTADIYLHRRMSAIGGKADTADVTRCLLLTQSGHTSSNPKTRVNYSTTCKVCFLLSSGCRELGAKLPLTEFC